MAETTTRATEETPSADPPYLDAGVRPGRDSPPGTPRWVKVFGIIALALVLLFVFMMLSGGSHGPGMHMPQ